MEGNVSIGKKKQGVGSYNRKFPNEGLLGFIDYFPNRTPEFDKSFANAVKGKISDPSNNMPVFSLPSDAVTGGEEASSTEAEKTDSTSGGILGKIISGARKFYNPDDSADDDISAEATSKAFASIGK